jgi:hypothetical protein
VDELFAVVGVKLGESYEGSAGEGKRGEMSSMLGGETCANESW